MCGVQVRVGDREEGKAVSCQAARQIHEQRGHRGWLQGYGSREPGGKLGGRIGDGREQHRLVAAGGEPPRRRAGHRLGDDHVGRER